MVGKVQYLQLNFVKIGCKKGAAVKVKKKVLDGLVDGWKDGWMDGLKAILRIGAIIMLIL